MRTLQFERIIWLLALLVLFFLDPARESLSVCVFKIIGFDWCPGCGLGHSVHYALRLDLSTSFSEHILGPFVTLFLLWKVIQPVLYSKPKNNGHQTNVGHPS